METFVTVVHIIVAVLLIALVLLQDSKSGSVGGAFGGATSNSVLGATGAATLAQKVTRGAAFVFAVTSITLSVFASRQHKSIMDGPISVPTQTAPATSAPTTPAPAEKAATPAPAPEAKK